VEKVAVLRDHTALIAGSLPPDAITVVNREAEARHVKPLYATGGGTVGFQAQNLMLALAAARQVLGEVDWDPAFQVRLQMSIPGRAQLEPGEPDVIYDAAHNPDGARALAELLHGLAHDRPVICCLAILEGKDAPGIVNGLAPAISHFVCTEIPPERIEGSGRPGGRSRPALEVTALCEKAGVDAEAIPDPLVAWERARELARQRGGVALAAGSHYLLSSIWTERPAQSS
jgi:folylpolyglutamate synthase/dihydropteroate synthase